MNPVIKYIAAGVIIGGLLPGMLHPLKITIFASTADISAHAVSILIATLISLAIYKLRNK